MNIFNKQKKKLGKFVELGQQSEQPTGSSSSVKDLAIGDPVVKQDSNQQDFTELFSMMKNLEFQLMKHNERESNLHANRMAVDYTLIEMPDGTTDILFQCNDGSFWCYNYSTAGTKGPVWRQLPNVPQ